MNLLKLKTCKDGSKNPASEEAFYFNRLRELPSNKITPQKWPTSSFFGQVFPDCRAI